MSMRNLFLLLGALALAMGCGSGDDGDKDAEDDTVYDLYEIEAPVGYAVTTPNNAFEGITWFVADISSNDPEADFLGAVVMAPEDRDSIHILETHCNHKRCGVVVSIDEYLDSTAQPIPRPIDADSIQFSLVTGAGTWDATLTIFPLEVSRSSSDGFPLKPSGTYMISELTLSGGASLIPNFSRVDEITRLYVAGPVIITSGIIDYTGEPGSGPTGGTGGPSAGSGGSAAEPAVEPTGQGPGQPGVGGGGGGGGGHAEAGWGGTDGTGTGGFGGASYGEDGLECVRKNDPLCGGSGGGIGSGAGGGGGGGALLIHSLDSITFTDAVVRTNGGSGGNGEAGGGGGSGGSIVFIAPMISGTVDMEANGGEGGSGSGGGGDGGKGGKGRLRFDGNATAATITTTTDYTYAGPAVDRTTLDLIVQDSFTTVTGFCEPASEVLIDSARITGPDGLFQATCTAEGTFSMDVDLLPGANELVMSQQSEGMPRVYSQIGNTFDISGTQVLGAKLTIVSVPDEE